MTMTDRPIPAALALPGQEEPLSDEEAQHAGRLMGQLVSLFAAKRIPEPLSLAELAELPPEELAALDIFEEPPARAAGFRIEDDGKAEWALRKLAELKPRRAEVIEQAQGWIAEIEAWQAEQLAPIDQGQAFFEGALCAYMRRIREANPKTASRKLPSGKLASTASKPRAAIADEAAVIAWAREHLEGEELEAAVQVKTKPLISGVKDHVSVSDRLIGRRFEGELGCGHGFSIHIPTDPDGKPLASGALPTVGQPWICPACPPEFGEAASAMILEMGEEEIREAFVADEETGEPVPGMRVEPATTTYRVELA